MSLIIPGHLSKYAQTQIEEIALTDNGAGVERIVSDIDGDHPDAHKPLELATMLLELVRKIVRPGKPRLTAQRFLALALHLCPDLVGVSAMACAKAIGVTRSSLSKTCISVADELALGHARWRKNESARIAYRSAQIKARLYGRHSSQTRRDRKGKGDSDKPAS